MCQTPPTLLEKSRATQAAAHAVPRAAGGGHLRMSACVTGSRPSGAAADPVDGPSDDVIHQQTRTAAGGATTRRTQQAPEPPEHQQAPAPPEHQQAQGHRQKARLQVGMPAMST